MRPRSRVHACADSLRAWLRPIRTREDSIFLVPEDAIAINLVKHPIQWGPAALDIRPASTIGEKAPRQRIPSGMRSPGFQAAKKTTRKTLFVHALKSNASGEFQAAWSGTLGGLQSGYRSEAAGIDLHVGWFVVAVIECVGGLDAELKFPQFFVPTAQGNSLHQRQ